jgi:predicted  nucleic acid-binding Zn-ribbon protein
LLSGDDVASELDTLIHLQEYDSRLAKLEAEAARLPKRIEAIRTSVGEARTAVEAVKAKVDATRKNLRAKEKDLEVVAAKRSKADAHLWEVKTNKEYSAVLVEIEDIKQEKARVEEEILALMEMQERLATETRDAEGRLKAREEQGNQDEASVRQQLAVVEAELTGVRGERTTLAREIPPGLLGDYERILKARGGLAIVPTMMGVCGGCRVSIRPQAIQELRSATLMRCESCGRYLYWSEGAV